LYFDTTSTYFEIEDEDDFRKNGLSKDHRPDLPQAVIGLSVTREGIPVRCWVWPGNTADMSVVQQVKNDLVDWKLGRVITVVDRGFSSEDNLKYLQRAGGHYIAGEKMRSGKGKTEQALSHPGRFKQVKDNLEVKEIIVGDGEARIRYILARNPKEVTRDKANRDKTINKIKAELAAIGELNGAPHTKAVCNLIAHPTYGRYLKTNKKGQPKLDQTKIKAEAKLDGKYLLRTSDDTISPEDVQAAPGSRRCISNLKDYSGAQAGVPPTGGPDPVPCAALLLALLLFFGNILCPGRQAAPLGLLGPVLP